jgi:aminoglycoside 6'-N-acetyltransferase
VILRGERVLLRPLEAGDLDRLTEILREPEVARWWGAVEPDRVREDLLDDAETETLAIEVEDAVVGALLIWEEPDPDYRHAALDIFLGTRHQGRGLGVEALTLAAHHLFAERGHHRLTIDPAEENERAIRAYERVGFRPVGVMRLYERSRDGSWHDGLLMDLLAPDLRD